MIRVLFFASVRDRLGVDAIDVAAADAGANLHTLRTFLAAKGGSWADVLGEDARLLGAINHQTVSMETSVDDGDEVAFFPPVTGG